MRSLQLLVGLLLVLPLAGCGASRATTPGSQPEPPAMAPATLSPTVMELRHWQAMKLLAEQTSVDISQGSPARLTIRSWSTTDTIGQVAKGIASVPSPGAVLGLALGVVAAPAIAANEASESKSEAKAEAALPDPILTVRGKLLTALKAEPTLSRVRWDLADCAGSPCATPTTVSIALRTTRRELCDGGGKTAGSWSLYAAELALSTPGAEWRTACLAGDPKPPSARAPLEEIEKHFDQLASACADQLVTALLGRGKALPSVAPPWSCS